MTTKKATAKKVTEDFNLDDLRLQQDFSSTLGVQKVLSHVPVRKPNKTDFVRVRNDDNYRMDVGMVELKEVNENYIVMPAMMNEPGIFELVFPVRLVTAVTRQGTLFLWPLKLPRDDGRENAWHSTAIEAADLALDQWVRVAADMAMGGYQAYVATGNLPEPEWPDYSFSELIQKAFKGKIVSEPDHPLIEQLLGAK